MKSFNNQADSTKTPLQVLKEVFGYSGFKPLQEKIIETVLSGKDVLALMPTGGGKSLCYQIPALCREGTALIISPLIALMKDQVDALRLNGVAAAYINSTQTTSEQNLYTNQMKEGKLKLVYLAPERIFGREEQFLNFIKTCKISLLAVDEAHCISQWGHDFRPEYLMLAKITGSLGPGVPTIALTATADEKTKLDIAEKLNLKNPEIFVASFNRPNIEYHVRPKHNGFSQLLEFLNQRKEDSGIIYTFRRADAELLAGKLKAAGFLADFYHAGVDPAEKHRRQDAFLKDEIRIIVATIAFGMGIDKSNVRYVVHMDLPKNVESYYQETGRAGRDGLPSVALLFYSYEDFFRLKKFTEIEDNPVQSEVMLKKLEQMADYGNLRTCRRKFLLNYFSEDFGRHCGSCDNCLENYESFDGTVIAQKALSAVARLKERFGINYVVDFLLGSESEPIRQEHTLIKTFGVGKDIERVDWVNYIHQLLYMNALEREQGKYPVLKLTEKSWKILKGETAVSLAKPKPRKYAPLQLGISSEDQELMTVLKRLRTKLAAAENVPPYVVFSDKTLQELAFYKPVYANRLQFIHGFGAAKIRKYGDGILELIRDYLAENSAGITKADQKNAAGVKDSNSENTGLYDGILNLLKKGKSAREIAKMKGITLGDCQKEFAEMIRLGWLDIEDVMPPPKVRMIMKALPAPGQALNLKTVKDQLPGEVSYGEIRMTAAVRERQQKLDHGN